MGFDVTLLRNVLEQFVDFLAEESADLILERPRFAHAVVVITDGNDRAEASCIRQLDQMTTTHLTATINDPRMSRSYEDDEIERALRQLTESRDLLESDIDNQSVNSEWRKEVSTSSRYSYDSRM
ncbi:hypothetical protein WR25_07867 [Diploscapter pachys]|uniref:Uncharacterized protein n=1 Tax=Diploscapter pachys TaxID=2018661 RepID=A0A2A2LGS9_9BILA|nr:hypothetical protein WR25_07867 [Diploscapter pachys]